MHALLSVPLCPEDVDMELRLARFEQLIARRPLLLNSVLLRQNPHNVHEWHKRVKLYDGNARQVRPFGKLYSNLVLLPHFIVVKRTQLTQMYGLPY